MSVDAEAVRRADDIEAHALADLIMRAPHDVVESLGVAIERHAGALAVRCRALPIALFNRVIGFGTIAPVDPTLIDEVVIRARDHGAAQLWIHAASIAGPELVAALTDRGFAPPRRARWSKMLRGVEPPPEIATDLRIEELGGDRADEVGEVLAAAFDAPPLLAPLLVSPIGRAPWRTFGALADDRVVGVGLLYQFGHAGWLGLGGTLPEFRRRGAQGALMARRIHEAIAAGCTSIATETGSPIGDEPNPSLDNMRRCGFALVDERANYARAV